MRAIAAALVALFLLPSVALATDQPKDRGEASATVTNCEVVFSFQFAKAKERRFAYVVQPGTDVPEWPRDNPDNVITETVTTDENGYYQSDAHVLASGTWTLVWDNESPIDKSFKTVTFEVDCKKKTPPPPTDPPSNPPTDPPKRTLPPSDTLTVTETPMEADISPVWFVLIAALAVLVAVRLAKGDDR